MANLNTTLRKLFNPSRSIPYWLLFILIATALIHSFLIDKHFACDGVVYFWEMLEKRDFVHHDWTRQYSLYITQWPVVIALKSGVNDLCFLNKLFSFGVFSVYLLSFSLCIYSLRGMEKTMLVWPLLSMAAFNLTTDYHLTGEFPVVMLLSWPILFLILRRHPTLTDLIILVLLLFTFTRIYQSAALIATVFIVLMVYQQFRLKSRRPRIWFVVLIFLCLAAQIIAVYSVVYPYSETNKDSFIKGLNLLIYNIPAVVAIGFTGLLFIGLITKKTWIILITLIPLLYYVSYILRYNQGTHISISFSSRTLSATFFPLLLVFSLVFYYRQIKLTPLPLLMVAVFIGVMVGSNIRFSNDWKVFREDFRSTLRQNTGFVPVEKTCLFNGGGYWNWTNPYLSLAWSEGCVQTIVLNDPPRRTFPFDPRRVLLLKEYLTYAPGFLEIDSTAHVCKNK
jgi:hypothetical protein